MMPPMKLGFRFSTEAERCLWQYPEDNFWEMAAVAVGEKDGRCSVGKRCLKDFEFIVNEENMPYLTIHGTSYRMFFSRLGFSRIQQLYKVGTSFIASLISQGGKIGRSYIQSLLDDMIAGRSGIKSPSPRIMIYEHPNSPQGFNDYTIREMLRDIDNTPKTSLEVCMLAKNVADTASLKPVAFRISDYGTTFRMMADEIVGIDLNYSLGSKFVHVRSLIKPMPDDIFLITENRDSCHQEVANVEIGEMVAKIIEATSVQWTEWEIYDTERQYPDMKEAIAEFIRCCKVRRVLTKWRRKICEEYSLKIKRDERVTVGLLLKIAAEEVKHINEPDQASRIEKVMYDLTGNFVFRSGRDRDRGRISRHLTDQDLREAEKFASRELPPPPQVVAAA